MLRARRAQTAPHRPQRYMGAALAMCTTATTTVAEGSCTVTMTPFSTATTTQHRTYFTTANAVLLAPKKRAGHSNRRDPLSKAAGGNGATNGVYDEDEVFTQTARSMSMSQRRKQQRQLQVREMRNARTAEKDAEFEAAVDHAGVDVPRNSRFQQAKTPAIPAPVRELPPTGEDDDLLTSIDLDVADEISTTGHYTDVQRTSGNTRVNRKQRMAAEATARDAAGPTQQQQSFTGFTGGGGGLGGLDFEAYSSKRDEDRGAEVTASFIEVKNGFLEAIKLRRVHESMPNDGTLIKLLQVLRNISPKLVLSSDELHQEEFRLVRFMIPVLAYVGEDAGSPLCRAVVQQFNTILTSNKGMGQAKAIQEASSLPKAVAVPPQFVSGSNRRGIVTNAGAASSTTSYRGSVPESRFNVDHLMPSFQQVYNNATHLETYLLARSFRRLEYYSEVHWKLLMEAAIRQISQFPPNDLYQLAWYVVKARNVLESCASSTGSGGGSPSVGANSAAAKAASLRLRHISASALGVSAEGLKKATLSQYDLFFTSLERRLLEPASEAEITRGAVQTEVQFRSNSSRMLRMSEKDKTHLTGRPFLALYTNHQHSGFLSAFRSVGAQSSLLSEGIEHHSHTMNKAGGLSSSENDAFKAKKREDELRKKVDGSEDGGEGYRGSSERELNSYYSQGLQKYYDTVVTEDQESEVMSELTRIHDADAALKASTNPSSVTSSMDGGASRGKRSNREGSASSLLIFSDKQTEQAVVACHVVLNRMQETAAATATTSSKKSSGTTATTISTTPLCFISSLDPPKMLTDLLAEEEMEENAAVPSNDNDEDWGDDFLATEGSSSKGAKKTGVNTESSSSMKSSSPTATSSSAGNNNNSRIALQRMLKDLNGILSATLRMASFRDRSLSVASPNKSSLRITPTSYNTNDSSVLSTNTDLVPSLLGSALGIAYHTNLPPTAATLLLRSTLSTLDTILANAPDLICNSLSSHLPSLLHRGVGGGSGSSTSTAAGPVSSQLPLLSWGELVSLLRVLVQLHANVSSAELAAPWASVSSADASATATVGSKLRGIILRLLDGVGPSGILDAIPSDERAALINRSIHNLPLTHLHNHPASTTATDTIPYFLWIPQQMPLVCELMDTLRHISAFFSTPGDRTLTSVPVVKALCLELSHKRLHFGKVGRGAWDGSVELRRGDWLRGITPSNTNASPEEVPRVVSAATQEMKALEKIVKAAGTRVGTKLNTLSSPAITKSAVLFVTAVCKSSPTPSPSRGNTAATSALPLDTNTILSTILDAKRYQIRDAVVEMSVGDLTHVIRALTNEPRLVSRAPNSNAVGAAHELLQAEITDDASDAGYEESLRSYKKPAEALTTTTISGKRVADGGVGVSDEAATPTPAVDLSKSKWERDITKPTARFLLPTFYRQLFRKSKKVGQNALDWDSRGEQSSAPHNKPQQTVASLFQPAEFERSTETFDEDSVVHDDSGIKVRRPQQGAFITPQMSLVLLHSMLVGGVKDTPLILAVLKPILHQYTLKYRLTESGSPAHSTQPADGSSSSSFTSHKNISALTDSNKATHHSVVAPYLDTHQQSAMARKFSNDSRSLTAMEIASLALWFVQLLGATDTKEYVLQHRLIQGLEDASTNTTPSNIVAKKGTPLLLSEDICGHTDNRRFVVDLCGRAIHAPGCGAPVLAKVMHTLSSLLVPNVAKSHATTNPSSPSWAAGGVDGGKKAGTDVIASGAEIVLLAESLRRLRPAVGEADITDLILILKSMMKLRTMAQFSNAFVGDDSSKGVSKIVKTDAESSAAALTKITGGVELIEAKYHQKRRDVEGVLGSSEILALSVKRALSTVSAASVKQIGELAMVLDGLNVRQALVEEVAAVMGARLSALYPAPTNNGTKKQNTTTPTAPVRQLSEVEANTLLTACVSLGKIGPTHLCPYITGTLLWQGHFRPNLLQYIAGEVREAVMPIASKDAAFMAAITKSLSEMGVADGVQTSDVASPLLTNPDTLLRLLKAMANSGAGDGLTLTSDSDRWLLGIASVCSTCVGRVMNYDASQDLHEWQNPLQLYITLLDGRATGELPKTSTMVTNTTITATLPTLVGISCHMVDLGFHAGGDTGTIATSGVSMEDLDREAERAASDKTPVERNITDVIPFLQTGMRYLFPTIFTHPAMKQRVVSRTEIGGRVGGGSSSSKQQGGGGAIGGNASLAWRKPITTPELQKEQDEDARKQRALEEAEEKERFERAALDDTRYESTDHPLRTFVVDRRDKIKERPELITALRRSNMVTWIVESQNDMDAILRGDSLPSSSKMSGPFGSLSMDAASTEALRILKLSDAHKAAEKEKKKGGGGGGKAIKEDEEIVNLASRGKNLDRFFASQQKDEGSGSGNTSFLSSLLGGMVTKGDRDAANLVVGASGDDLRVAQMLGSIGIGRSTSSSSSTHGQSDKSPAAALRAMKRAKNEAKKNLHEMGIMDEEDAILLQKEVEKRMKRRLRSDAISGDDGEGAGADDGEVAVAGKKKKKGTGGGALSTSLINILHEKDAEMSAHAARSDEDDDEDEDHEDDDSIDVVDAREQRLSGDKSGPTVKAATKRPAPKVVVKKTTAKPAVKKPAPKRK